jgi:hypothetical protein
MPLLAASSLLTKKTSGGEGSQAEGREKITKEEKGSEKRGKEERVSADVAALESVEDNFYAKMVSNASNCRASCDGGAVRDFRPRIHTCKSQCRSINVPVSTVAIFGRPGKVYKDENKSGEKEAS